MMAEEIVNISAHKALAKQLIKRMGRTGAIQVCEANKWQNVLEQIKMVDKHLNNK